MMPDRTISLEASHLMLVEGDEEKRFFDAVLKTWDRSDVQTIPVGGKHELRNRLSAVVRLPGFEEVRWIAITQDADADAHAAFQRICGALEHVSLPVPVGPWKATNTSPVVIALVLPDGTNSGDLETLLLEALGETPTMRCVDSYFQCLQNEGVPLPRQTSKSKVHAFLSSLEPPDLRLGEAAERRVLPLESPVFAKLQELLPKS